MNNQEFNYNGQKLENIPCNLCGEDNFAIIARRSANGLPVNTCLCRNCGLIYINPRMTKEGYDEYYKYHYRHDRALAKGKEDAGGDLEKNFSAARKFGSALAGRLREYLGSGITLDIGSSTGGVLQGLKDVVPDLEVVGVEPSVAESGFANQKGIKTHVSLFENLPRETIASAQNILCVQSLNHLLDPRSFFQRCFDYLEEGGHLILSVKNFRHQARRAGSIEAGVQIDHPYMFTPETLKLFVESIGFRVVYLDVDEGKPQRDLIQQRKEGLSRHHIRLVAEKPKGKKIAVAEVSRPDIYRQMRRQFSRPYLKLYYLLFYSHRLGFLRKIFQ